MLSRNTLSFILCGAACLIPWQAEISSLDFFMILLPTRKMQFMIPILNMIAILITTILVVLFARHFSPLRRVVVSGIFLCVGLSIVPIQNYILLAHGIMFNNGTLANDNHEPTIYWTVLGSTLLCAIFSSIMQSSLFGLAGAMSTGDGALTGALTLGQGIAGVSVVSLRCVTKALLGDAYAAKSTLLFFALGLAQVVVSLIVFVVAMLQEEEQGEEEEEEEEESHHNSINYVALEERQVDENKHDNESTASTWNVLTKVWRQAGTACLVFTTCIACFPGLTASLTSTTFHLGRLVAHCCCRSLLMSNFFFFYLIFIEFLFSFSIFC